MTMIRTTTVTETMTTTATPERRLPNHGYVSEQQRRDHHLGTGRLIAEVYTDSRTGRFMRTHKQLGENGCFTTPGANPWDNVWHPAPEPVMQPLESLRARRHFWSQVEVRYAHAYRHMDASVNHGAPPMHWPEWLMGKPLVDEMGNYLPGPQALVIVGERLREARENLAKIDSELAKLDADRRNRSNIRLTQPISNLVMTDFDTPR